MGQIINLVNGHNRPHVDHKIVQHLEASLVSQWRCVLHDTDDEDIEQTSEDRRLTAALGMAIGHTRRLCARLPNEANGTLHGYKPSHATRLEIANIEAWLHEEGLQIPVDSYNETVQIRIVNHSGDEKEKNHAQQESSGDPTDQSEEDEVSSEGTRINETD